jgi:dipeptidyl aminopeptidase/acylaminoacyl peptidase
MSPANRNISVAVAVLVLCLAATFGVRGCRPSQRSTAGQITAEPPPIAPEQTSADSTRKPQIYFHREFGLSKIIPGEGLIRRLPDPAEADRLSYQLQSDRLSPDATRIAFGKAVTREIDGLYSAFPPDAVYVRRIDNSDPAELLIKIEGSEIRNFVWLPDGTCLAVVSWDKEQGIRNWIVDVKTRKAEEARLPRYNPGGGEQSMAIAAWSPDGEWVLASYDDGLNVVRMEHKAGLWSWAGGSRFAADRHSFVTGAIVYSPDGRRAAYVVIEKEISMSLQIADVSGGNQRTIVPAGQFTDLYPAWSPDGRRIAFSGARLDATGQRAGQSGIYTVVVDPQAGEPSPVLEEFHPPPVFRLRVLEWR